MTNKNYFSAKNKKIYQMNFLENVQVKNST